MKKVLVLLLLVSAVVTTYAGEYPPSVAPLLSSTWGQRAPYNFMCPLKTPTPWGGYLPDEQHCLAGCVAVAMGQIMRYHHWPEKGEGHHSVVYPVLNSNANIFTVDFSEATYDWDNMLDDYSGDYTEAQARAVSQLLYHCAVASNMLFEKTFSFSTNFTAGDALVKYFHYDGKRMQTRMRSDYGRNEWLNMIREELSQGRPIFYEAISISLTEGIYAHSFVIDGYNEDGLVHVNWGWYGHEDGYYDIDLLDPPGYSFNSYQDMITGIQPVNEDTGINLLANDTPTADVYTLDGRLIRHNAASLDGLPAGIYLWKGKKIIKKPY